jgi:hypothetical protein
MPGATVQQMGRRSTSACPHRVEQGMTNTVLPAPVTVAPATVTVRTIKPMGIDDTNPACCSHTSNKAPEYGT